jgi:hypothetical protein
MLCSRFYIAGVSVAYSPDMTGGDSCRIFDMRQALLIEYLTVD